MLSYLLQAFSGPAGAFMYVLLVVGAFAMAVAIERAVSLMRATCDADALLAAVEPKLKSGEPLALGDTPMEKVVAAGAKYTDSEMAWEAMTAEAVRAELSIKRRVSYLSAVASISTMIGLVGTVYGLIIAFGAVGDAAGAERAARLSEGSATAMATTAFGLMVAIPAMAAHAIADARCRELLGQIEHVAGRVALAIKANRS